MDPSDHRRHAWPYPGFPSKRQRFDGPPLPPPPGHAGSARSYETGYAPRSPFVGRRSPPPRERSPPRRGPLPGRQPAGKAARAFSATPQRLSSLLRCNSACMYSLEKHHQVVERLTEAYLQAEHDVSVQASGAECLPSITDPFGLVRCLPQLPPIPC